MKLSDEILVWQTVIIGIIGLLTIGIYWLINDTNKKIARQSESFNKISTLNTRLQTILQTSIEYPYLIITSITADLVAQDNSENDLTMRYYSYCGLVFNFLEEVFIHFDGDKYKIQNYCDVKSITLKHKNWWIKKSVELQESYSKKFREHIQSIIVENINTTVQINK